MIIVLESEEVAEAIRLAELITDVDYPHDLRNGISNEVKNMVVSIILSRLGLLPNVELEALTESKDVVDMIDTLFELPIFSYLKDLPFDVITDVKLVNRYGCIRIHCKT